MSRQEQLKRLEELVKEYNTIAGWLTNEGTSNQPSEAAEHQLIKKSKILQYETTIKDLKAENQNYAKDVNILTKIMKGLNHQLNRYLLKNYAKEDLDPDVESTIEDDRDESRAKLYQFHSLMLAYDEVINQQDLSLEELSKKLETAFIRMRKLQQENSNYLKYLEHIDLEGVSIIDMKQVSSDAKLLVEERELLLLEIVLLKEKLKQSEMEYNKITRPLEIKFGEARETEIALRAELDKKKKDLQIIQEENLFLRQQLKNSVTEEEHKRAVNECGRHFDKLKKAYGEECLNMKSHFHEAKEEKTNLVEKVKGMKSAVVSYKTHLRKNQSRLSYQYNLIRSLQATRRTMQSKLRELARVCSNLIQDRKHLLQSFQNCKREARKCSHESIIKSSELGKLAHKYKEDHLRLTQRLTELDAKRLAAEESWSLSTKECSRLRNLLQSKDITLKTLLSDYRAGNVAD